MMSEAKLQPNDPDIRQLAQELIAEAIEGDPAMRARMQDKSASGFYISLEGGEYVFRFRAYHGQFPEGLPCFEFRPLPVAIGIVCKNLKWGKTLEKDAARVRRTAGRGIKRMVIESQKLFDLMFYMLIDIPHTLTLADALGSFDPEINAKLKLSHLACIDSRLRHLLHIEQKEPGAIIAEGDRRTKSPAFSDYAAIRAIESQEKPSVRKTAAILNCAHDTVRQWARRRGYESFEALACEVKAHEVEEGDGGK